jgi:hypothetical protein
MKKSILTLVALAGLVYLTGCAPDEPRSTTTTTEETTVHRPAAEQTTTTTESVRPGY